LSVSCLFGKADAYDVFGNQLPKIRIDASLLSFSLAPPGEQRRRGKEIFFRLGGLRKPLKRLISDKEIQENQPVSRVFHSAPERSKRVMPSVAGPSAN
jgi:hypothetical protein